VAGGELDGLAGVHALSHVVGQRRERVLHCHHPVPRFVQPRDDAPPVRAVAERTMHEHDVGLAPVGRGGQAVSRSQ
jgi:hypothetical protein